MMRFTTRKVPPYLRETCGPVIDETGPLTPGENVELPGPYSFHQVYLKT